MAWTPQEQIDKLVARVSPVMRSVTLAGQEFTFRSAEEMENALRTILAGPSLRLARAMRRKGATYYDLAIICGATRNILRRRVGDIPRTIWAEARKVRRNREEVRRVVGITEACRAARMPWSFARRLIESKMALSEARQRIINEIPAGRA